MQVPLALRRPAPRLSGHGMTMDRITRVNELLKRELSLVVERKISVDVTALVTVTEVQTSGDLRHAKAFISVYGSEEQKAQVMRLLVGRRKEIQQLMMKHVTLKFTPVLEFKLDDRYGQADKVLRLLDELETEDSAKPED
jgi:ribosome-binding factor A